MSKLRPDQKGATSIIELLVIIMILIVVTTTITLFIYPVRQRKHARDLVRISDLDLLARAIEEYALDHNNTPPDIEVTTRTSNVLPTGSAGPLDSNNGEGWISQSFVGYTSKLPLDPVNTGSSVYRYRRSGTAYEVDAVLEQLTTEMTKDGGDDSGKYEIGSNKTIL